MSPSLIAHGDTILVNSQLMESAMSVQAQLRIIGSEARPTGPKNYREHPRRIAPGSDAYQGIVRDLLAQKSYYRTARDHGCSVNTTRRIAEREGIVRVDLKTREAVKARASYCHEKRLELLDRALAKVESLLDSIDNPRDMQPLAASPGLLR